MKAVAINKYLDYRASIFMQNVIGLVLVLMLAASVPAQDAAMKKHRRVSLHGRSTLNNRSANRSVGRNVFIKNKIINKRTLEKL